MSDAVTVFENEDLLSAFAGLRAMTATDTAREKVDALAAQMKEPSAPSAGTKHDTDKVDLTLIPWDRVADPAQVQLILPLYLWWRRGLPARSVHLRMRDVWKQRGWSFTGDMAASMNHGKTKYAPWNWELGLSAHRLYAAACRHYEAIERGEEIDESSGTPHHAALTFYAAAIFAASPDDRPQERT